MLVLLPRGFVLAAIAADCGAPSCCGGGRRYNKAQMENSTNEVERLIKTTQVTALTKGAAPLALASVAIPFLADTPR